MHIYTKDEFKLKQKVLENEIVKGAVFIYATDTIYGIGCNALMSGAVKRVRDIKKTKNSFSVIAPSKDWIKKNCEVSKEADEWLKKLPGPYTLIFKIKNKEAVANGVTFNDFLGVRIPEHHCAQMAENINVPIITTSANVHGDNFMISLEDLSLDIKSKVDFIIYEGELRGTPSTLVKFNNTVEVKER